VKSDNRHSCMHHDHESDSRIMLLLLMPREQGKVLVARLDQVKRDGEVASIGINAMHIVGIMTTDDDVVPEGSKGWQTRTRGIWWPIQATYILVMVVVGVAISTMDQPWRGIALGIVWFAWAYTHTRREGWRWRLREKPKPADATPKEDEGATNG
jgi:hypothetical protein